MGNILQLFSSLKPNRKSTTSVIYISNKTTPAYHEQKTAEKMTQFKQPKKAGLFQAKKSAAAAAPQSEVDRIIAGMQRHA